MTVTSTTRKTAFNGDGATVLFSITFKVFATSDLQVFLGGVLQTEITDYTVALQGTPAGVDGADVTFVVAPPSGTGNVDIVRVLPSTQGISLPIAGKFPSTTVEEGLDRAVMLLQEKSEDIDRALKLASTSSIASVTLPEPGATKLFRWNAAGLAIELVTLATGDTLDVLTTLGDIIRGGAAGAAERLGVGANDSFFQVKAGQPGWRTLAQVLDDIGPRGYLAGLGTSNGTDATNDIDVAVGVARNKTDDGNLKVAAAIGKQIDVSWAAGGTPGAPTGGLSSSLTLTNDTWYHVHLILVGGTVEVGFDTSVTAANLITDHSATKFRRIGSVLRGTALIELYTQLGDVFLWKATVDDVNVTNQGAGAVDATMTVPIDVQVGWLGNSTIIAGTSNPRIYFSSKDVTDEGASAQRGQQIAITGQDGQDEVGVGPIRTNTSAVIRTRWSGTSATTNMLMGTFGWIDRRGRDD